jgi:hypothetical protein
MRTFLNIASLIVILASTGTIVSGQKLKCACEYQNSKDSKDHCKVNTGRDDGCDDGCTAICGPRGSCGSFCRRGPYEQQHLTVTFEKKTGEQIAAELSGLAHQEIQFKPYRPYKTFKYDVIMKNDEVFNVLNILSKRGSVTIDGVDYLKIKESLIKKNSGKQIPPFL